MTNNIDDLLSLPSEFSTIAQREMNELGFGKNAFPRGEILSSGNETNAVAVVGEATVPKTEPLATIPEQLEDGSFVFQAEDVVCGGVIVEQQQQQQQQQYHCEPMSSSLATRANPSMEDFPGELGFDVRVPPPVKSKDAQVSSFIS